MWHFLNCVQGQSNGLLRAVHADKQVDLYLSGCKVLGILNKLITAPLWRIVEESGHILDMCDHYTFISLSFMQTVENILDPMVIGL